MHYYKFNIGDWHLHTSHLTLVEEAVYFRLVNHYYNTEKPFAKEETQTLIRRLRLGSESVIVEQILSEFFVLKDESYFHSRCDKEIKTFKNKAKVNKANGAKGGRPPAAKGLEPNPEKTQTVSEINPNITLNTNHKPLTTNQETITTKHNINNIDDSFNLFWDAGLVKTGKKKAEQIFKSKYKQAAHPNLFADMLIKDIKTRLSSGQFGFDKIHPATYLNGERWNDELPATNRNQITASASTTFNNVQNVELI